MISTNRNKKISRRTIVLALAAFAFFQFAFIGIDLAVAKDNGTWIGNMFMDALVWLLYSVYWVVSQPVSIAASILGYAVDPAGWAVFNNSGAYDVWQAVRDFFNLFFILALLFSAFATIFQVEQYHVRRILPKIVLVALLVNFSWPISRFIVDATNVPMYFFLESTFTATPTTSAGQALVETSFSAANMRNIILPNSESKARLKDANPGDLGALSIKLLIAIVFMFIFGVSLLVLAVMFLIRLIMLLILVMFSPVGFAGAAIPGFQKYASEWWRKLMQYALFGPVAALMILVAVTVMRAFKANDQPMKDIAGAVNNSDPTALASMALAIIPIILIWVAITASQKMGIYGSNAVTGRAQAISKWAGRKVSFYDSGKRRWDAYNAERQARAAEKFKSNNIGTRFGKFVNRHQDELIATGGGGFYSKSKRMDARNRFLAAQKQKVDETAKQHGINENMNDTMLKQKHEDAQKMKDKSLLAATTKELSRKERGGDMNKLVTDADMQAIDKHFAGMDGIKNSVAEDTRNEVAKTNAAVAYGNDETEMTKAFASGKIKVEDQNGAALTSKLLVAASNAGKLDQKILDEMRKDADKKDALDKNLADAVATVEKRYQDAVKPGSGVSAMEQKRAENQRIKMQQSYFSHTGEFHKDVDTDTKLIAEVFKKADATTLKNVDKANIGQYKDYIAQNMPIGKVVNVLAELNETNSELAKNMASDLKATTSTGAVGSRERAVYESLKNDRRTQGLMT